MSTTAPIQVARRPVALRAGLVLSVLLALGGTIPAVFDIGFDGTGWDAVVVVVAIVSPLILVATLVLLPSAWRGRRTPALAIAALQIAAILPALPPYLHAPGQLPPEAAISATVGIVLNLFAVALIVLGAPARR